jgi:hypothetical protein
LKEACDDMWICDTGRVPFSCELKIMAGKCEKFDTIIELTQYLKQHREEGKS